MKISSLLAALVISLTVTTSVVGAQAKKKAESKKPAAKTITTKSGLKYIDVVVGKGAVAKLGQSVKVHYTGTFPGGKKFDASRDHGGPFEFQIGGRVIAGWNEGVQGMKVGGTRKLIVPGNLAYGPDGRDGIPPNATLLFTIELLEIAK